jgi:hypothetical protein
MFVRFRERKSGGREPRVYAERACVGRCADRNGQRYGPGFRVGTGCPMKPRCGWLIDGKSPYRLLVSLSETRRVGGKVRQEHIADLGAIDGHLLPSFWGDAIKDPAEWWHADSSLARRAFWDELNERLSRLSNRISVDEAVKIRASVDARIPRPSAKEIEQVEAWIAGQEPELWEELGGDYKRLIDSDRNEIVTWERHIEEVRQRIMALETDQKVIDANISVIRTRLAQGDRSVAEESAKAREKQTLIVGRIMAAKMRSG